MRSYSSSIVALFFLLLIPAISWAHGIGLEVRLAGTQVTLEAFYDDNTPVAEAKTRLLNLEGGVLREGQTNSQGAWTFPSPPVGKYKVEVRTEDGHFSRTTIAIPEQTGTQADGSAPGDVVSEGQSREERTGIRKWAKAIIGLLVILLGAFGVQWFKNQGATGSNQDPNKPGDANHDP